MCLLQSIFWERFELHVMSKCAKHR